MRHVAPLGESVQVRKSNPVKSIELKSDDANSDRDELGERNQEISNTVDKLGSTIFTTESFETCSIITILPFSSLQADAR